MSRPLTAEAARERLASFVGPLDFSLFQKIVMDNESPKPRPPAACCVANRQRSADAFGLASPLPRALLSPLRRFKQR
jgi:hypothetical protein